MSDVFSLSLPLFFFLCFPHLVFSFLILLLNSLSFLFWCGNHRDLHHPPSALLFSFPDDIEHEWLQIGSIAGFSIIVVCQSMEVFIFPDIFSDVPLKMYGAVTLLPLLGILLGFAAASAFRLDQVIRRTIAIECGIQNVGTALAIVSLSYPYHVSYLPPTLILE